MKSYRLARRSWVLRGVVRGFSEEARKRCFPSPAFGGFGFIVILVVRTELPLLRYLPELPVRSEYSLGVMTLVIRMATDTFNTRTSSPDKPREPRQIVADKLRSYSLAHRELIPNTIHDTSQYANNRAELTHQPTEVSVRFAQLVRLCHRFS